MFSRVIGLARDKGIWSVFFVAVAVLILGLSAPVIWADAGEIPFADTKIIFETNFTDKDTGIQISLDGDPWQEVGVKGPDGKLVEVKTKGNLKTFGLTELFFESNEPNYAELPLADILALFSVGEYQFRGKTVEGDKLVGDAELEHDLPCGPEVSVVVGGSNDVTINWLPVTSKIDPATETCVAGGPTIDGYQVIVENEHTFNITLPAEVTTVTVPAQFFEPGTDYKFEVLAIAESGNQTITEAEFSTP